MPVKYVKLLKMAPKLITYLANLQIAKGKMQEQLSSGHRTPSAVASGSLLHQQRHDV